jgi:hypothetical protein
MPIIRKILNIGDSKAVTLPKSWIENAEEGAGLKVIALALEVNGSIVLQPVFEKKIKNRRNSEKY